MLRLRGVTVTDRGARLLDEVDWAVTDGQRWVVLGPNGAGKTTLLRVAGALRAPNAGRVELLGEPLETADRSELRARIGLTSVTVRERLPRRNPVVEVVAAAAYGAPRGSRRPLDPVDERRAREVLARLGCRALADRAYGGLSEGERQRVGLARALMADPELLLLDEPTAGLDLGAREALLRLLTRLAADPAAPVPVLVTHRVEEIPAGFSHLLLLRAGRVVAAGPLAATLTSGALSACFGLPLRLDRVGERWSASAVLDRTLAEPA